MKFYSLRKFFFLLPALSLFAACGYSQPNLNTGFYSQQGFCPTGMVNQNGICVTSNQGSHPTSYCQAGSAYPMSYPGYCNQGFAPMNGMCVCQSTSQEPNSQPQGSNSGQNQCRSGYSYAAGGCYQQGICRSGFVFVTPYGMCYPVGN
jgi:hypothetical protein